MNIFNLRDYVLRDYRSFATSFTKIYAQDIKSQVENIYSSNRYWPEPLLQINPSYEVSTSIKDLARDGTLNPLCEEIFAIDGHPINLYRHQAEAIALAEKKLSYVVTTGTGSGKSLCFFIPIVSQILNSKKQSKAKRTQAIIIYPMNALANSQLKEIEKFQRNVAPDTITVASYTGQENEEERRKVANNPPDILLTNFVMLELLMTRQDELDRKVINNCVGLNYLVLDELHTYRGRQGADVAMLVRRVREQLSGGALQCVGTSATMVSDDSLKLSKYSKDELSDPRAKVVAEVASKIFATDINESQVIRETLLRTTNVRLNSETVMPFLADSILKPLSKNSSNKEISENPLAVWVETHLGMEYQSNGRWERAKPKTFSEAVESLAQQSKTSKETAETVLREFLTIANTTEKDRTANGEEKPFFGFKLHQFISGAGTAYSTLESIGNRRLTVEPQQFYPGTKDVRLYSTHFCRECGQEYHPVKKINSDGQQTITARDIDDVSLSSEGSIDQDDFLQDQYGFVTLQPRDDEFDFTGDVLDFPEHWLEYNADNVPRLKATYARQVPTTFYVKPNGVLENGGHKAWFIRGKFKFCLRCRTSHDTSSKDRNRLASLSAEGRSSATTILVSSVLSWMNDSESKMPEVIRKLLGFSDNRQDAALQAGHFNDFINVSLIRAGFLGSLENAGSKGLSIQDLGLQQQLALGFDSKDTEIRSEWLQEPDLRGFNFNEAERTLREVLEYRVWFDQRRGWRYTNPNLETLKLMCVEYSGIDELAADESLFTDGPAILNEATKETREKVYKEFFDHLRQAMAIKAPVLDATYLETLISKSNNRLRSPWGFSIEEKRPKPAKWFVLNPPKRRELSLQDEDLLVRGGLRSSLGKKLKSKELWAGDLRISQINQAEYGELIETLVDAAVKHGLLSEEQTSFDEVPGWLLNANAITFYINENQGTDVKNKFFVQFYKNLALSLKHNANMIFGFEAREHTAQVDQEKRKIRELRFRYGKDEVSELNQRKLELKEQGESSRFLPVMFCSPTMELGVDISALNVVYLRNIPPTPANYAQRSGRAGRSGQAALVLTYCAALSPHDQYFFKSPRDMVQGSVKAPLLDLANRDLIDSHLQAIWLACTEQPLNASISKILDLSKQGMPVSDEINQGLNKNGAVGLAASRMEKVLEMVKDELTPEKAPWYTGARNYSNSVALESFNRFEKAFKRWRDLISAAEDQKKESRLVIDNHSASKRDRDSAERRHAQAIDQIDLLRDGNEKSSSDFYTYRYLATEGFLPGYNFPRLPLMAYVPASKDRKGRQTYLQRPRFLALSEFGPRSLVYHEGRSFQVERLLLSVGPQAVGGAATNLPTKSARICKICGAGHFTDEFANCHSCDSPLADVDILPEIYRVENVGTRQVERITANDEDRRRQGFDLQTIYQWSFRDGHLDIRKGEAVFEENPIAKLVYGPTATITRVNKGLKRRRNQTVFGFMVDPLTGYWAKNEDEDEDVNDPQGNPRQRIVPAVEDRKNALYFAPEVQGIATEMTMPTIQYALLRGIEEVFQLEEGEVLAEPMPKKDVRNAFLLYEAAEGGAGVLTRLVSDPKIISLIALEGLRIMHFEIDNDTLPKTADGIKDVSGEVCVAACYKCLMSYYNQTDHEIIDRRDVAAKNTLLSLAKSTITNLLNGPMVADIPNDTETLDLSKNWVNSFRKLGLMKWTSLKKTTASSKPILSWKKFFVAVLFEENIEQQQLLEDSGFKLVLFSSDEQSWAIQFEKLSELLREE